MVTSYLDKLNNKQSLSVDESRALFDILFSGAVGEDQMAQILLALHNKGESADEILGAVISMREKALTIQAPEGAVDIVGTGGDLHGTYNISTAAALVVAACGVPVAKHGNRAATSKSGSSDVLVALGINLDASFAALERCLAKANLCFMFAPRHHPAMQHVIAVRKKLGIRTIFNLLGPMTNPANVKHHLIGVFGREWMHPMAHVLSQLGSHAAWITHGNDGMDEITTTTTSEVVALKETVITGFTVSPKVVGIMPPAMEDLLGGDADHNAVAIHKLLLGEKSAYRDIVVLNAAAALVVSGKFPNLNQGIELAGESLDSGAVRNTLQQVIDITNSVFI